MGDEVMTASGGWFPVLTLVLGFGFSQLSEFVKDRRTHEREKETRDLARRDVLLERRNSSQRETLLALQGAAMKVMQTTSSLHHFELMSYRKHGRRHAEPIPQEVNNANQQANAETAMLVVRVRDEAVRTLLQEFKQHLGVAFISHEIEERQHELNVAGQVFVTLNNRIGKVIRVLDEIELSTL